MSKLISISLNPNFTPNDIKFIKSDKQGNVADLEKKVEKYFVNKKVTIVEKGRDGLQLLLKVLKLKHDDEVIIQAFTCSVVPMSIMAVGAKVVYVDIDDDYNIDLVDLKNKINRKTKAIIVQHTFGMPVKMNKLKEIVGEKIVIIEDLAHGLDNSYQGKKLGLWGDAAILSFGRDKVISGIWGGAIVANKEITNKIGDLTKNLPTRDNVWTQKQINYALSMEFIIKWYSLGIGKIVHWWIKKNKYFDQPLSVNEKNGRPKKMYQKLPDKLVKIIDYQWNKLDKYIERRKDIAKMYASALGEKFNDNCSYLRYSTEVDNPNNLRQFAANKNIFLGDWYDQVIAPKSVNPNIFGYQQGSCPKAEKSSQRIVNLPTNPRLSNQEINRVINIIKQWKSNK